MGDGQLGRNAGSGLFLVFGLFLLLQHWQIFPYHDDWGYAVLSYVTEQTGFVGQHFSQVQLLRFLYDEYMQWSPRFMAFFIQINLFKVGLDAVRLAQVAVLLGLLALSARIVTSRIRHPLIGLGILFFLTWPSFITVGGLYWFSASIAYVWGIIPLLMGAWWLRQDETLSWRSVLCLSLAALFQEQMAVAVLGLVVTFLGARWLAGALVFAKPLWWRCVPILMASGLVVLSPGNFARKSHSSYGDDSLLGIIGHNASRIGELIAGSSSGALAWCLFLAGVCMLSWRYLRDTGKSTRFSILTLLVVLIVTLGLAQLQPVTAVLAVWLIWALLLLRLALRSIIETVILSLLLAALSSLVLLLLAPSVSGRSLLIFYVLMLAPLLHAMHNFATDTHHRAILATVMLSVLPFAIIDTTTVFQGYAQNRPVHQLNDARLRVLSHDIRTGHNAPDTVVLYKLPADRYAETMPYQRPLIEHWMKKYYGLPPDLEFQWQ